jgi:hypothetical protein
MSSTITGLAEGRGGSGTGPRILLYKTQRRKIWQSQLAGKCSPSGPKGVKFFSRLIK